MSEKFIPAYLVKFNQAVLVVGTGLALIFQQPLVLLALFILLVVPLLTGPRLNLIFMLGKWLLPRSLAEKSDQEAYELQRFNQSIATILLGIASTVLLISGHWSGWVFSTMVTIAAGIALAGFCIGCFIYFQWKQWQHKLK